MYGNWSKSDITTRISNLNTLTVHEAHADWSNWPKTITITVDGKATTHKTLRDAMHTLMDTDPFYEDREPETTTTEIKEEPKMKKLTAAQQKVIDSIKASAAKFAGKTYEEAYPRVEDRDRWTKRVYENAQKGRYLVEAHPNTIAALLKAGIIDREGNSLFYWLVEDKKEEETVNTKPTTKAEAIEAMDDDAEDPSVTLDEFIAKVQETDNMKEDEPMNQEITLNTPKTFEREGGRSAVTITKLWRQYPTDNWTLVDDDHTTWYRKPQWDEDGKLAFYMPDSVKGQRILMTEQELNDMINNMKEDTTMKTTNTSNPVTIDLTEGVAKFELDGTIYKYTIDSKRYAKTTPDGKTKRIGKAEYDEAKAKYDIAWATYEQEKLDAKPSRVEVENDLDKPAKLNEFGCVDCSKCNVEKCVHRDCMRRNPQNVGGLGECPRLDNGIVSEAQKIAEETGMELAEAELEANIRNEQKKARKARKSKDIAYEGNGVTLTAKQVDFLLDLKMTDQWDGFDTMLWTDVICDEIEGQFAGKPMTVGAMISTLCEKGLAERSKGEFTDPVTNRTRKSTYMAFTGLGQKIAEELGL